MYALSVEPLTTGIRVETMLKLFQEFITPEQKKAAAMVEKRGGIAILEDKQAMRELADVDLPFTAPSGSDSQRDEDRRLDVVELRREIEGDPDDAIEKNAESFDRKFSVQRRQIREDFARAASREGDRIISAVTAGPHDRIVDPVRHEVSSRCIIQPAPFSLRIFTTSGRTW